MKSYLSTRALFLGSAASGLLSGAISPIVLFASALATRGLPEANSSGSFTLEGVGVLLLSSLIVGGIGVIAAVSAGFPILVALRDADRLSDISAPLAGVVVGLSAGLLLWLLDSFKPRIFLIAGLIGALSGWVALRIAHNISMRPNKSLERTRER